MFVSQFMPITKHKSASIVMVCDGNFLLHSVDKHVSEMLDKRWLINDLFFSIVAMDGSSCWSCSETIMMLMS